MHELLGSLFPGIAAMANLHPLVVHYPIALLSAFLLMEVLGTFLMIDRFKAAATWMLYLGTLGAAAAVVAGFIGAASVEHTEEVHEILELHEHLGLTVLGLAVFLSAWRILVLGRFSYKAQIIHIVVGAVMVGVMVFGADFGGLMVYKHGVGTELSSGGGQAGAPPHSHGDAGAHGSTPHAH